MQETLATAGMEWLVDAQECDADRLRDLDLLTKTCTEIVATLDLHVVGKPVWHRFPHPGGVTGFYLLTESHLACHTYPELGLATFNLYCCRPRRPWRWQERLQQLLSAAHVVVRTVPRGLPVLQPQGGDA
jgi:S-adenosylmethionine decarboxylase